MNKITVVVFICLISFSKLAFSEQNNEMPMYGGKSFTAEDSKINEQFVQGITGVYGKEAAYEGMLIEGWLKFFKGRYDLAMKRFNQAWLIDSENPLTSMGFAQILLMRREPAEAINFLEKAATSGIAVAQNELGNFYEKGIELNGKIILPEDTAKADEWYGEADKRGYSGMWKNLRRGGKAEEFKVFSGIRGTFTPVAMVNKVNDQNQQKFALDNPHADEGKFTTNDIERLVEVIKKSSEKQVQSGVWLIISNHDIFAKSDEEDLSQLAKRLNREGIQLLTCLSNELPDGWKTVAAN